MKRSHSRTGSSPQLMWATKRLISGPVKMSILAFTSRELATALPVPLLPIPTSAAFFTCRILAAGAFYSSIWRADDGANSSYNALLLKAEHRFSDHYTVLANYTYSHCISTADFIGDLGGALTQNPYDRDAERGNCGFDLRHIFNLSLVVETPRLKSRWGDRLVGIWKLSPILTAHSGVWFTPVTGLDNSLTGIGLDRPNVVGNPYVRNTSTLQWLSPSAFVPNALGSFGNAGSDSLVGPMFFNIDASLSREFSIKERARLQLRFEFFNLLNHPNFSNPDNNLQDNTFGEILSDGGPRILQFAGKFTF